MDDGLGSQIATSAVPSGISFNRVPSGTQGGGGEVTWDEMGQLGLHKALNEYYKLSASQRTMRLCGRGGAPSLLCKLVHATVCPQLPAALAPPALLAAGGWLLYAGAWLLYSTAPLTIPLALGLACAADGRLGLAPHAAAAAARLHPAAGGAAACLSRAALQLPAGMQHAAVMAALLGGLFLLLRLAEAAVLSRRRERWEAAQRRIAAADVQAAYAGWALPGAAADPAPAPAAALEQPQQLRAAPPLPPPSPALLSVLQGEVHQLWHSVFATPLPASSLQSYEDIGAAVDRLSAETGVELRQPAAASKPTNGSSPLTDPGRQLLDALLQIKHAVGVA
ncbi:hypothetical protein ABPG75_008428 [Micractinium tetrahymenae]